MQLDDTVRRTSSLNRRCVPSLSSSRLGEAGSALENLEKVLCEREVVIGQELDRIDMSERCSRLLLLFLRSTRTGSLKTALTSDEAG